MSEDNCTLYLVNWSELKLGIITLGVASTVCFFAILLILLIVFVILSRMDNVLAEVAKEAGVSNSRLQNRPIDSAGDVCENV